ncbi:MAG: hypothetical protein AAGD38_04180 [Acidobacteriota bacterium]
MIKILPLLLVCLVACAAPEASEVPEEAPPEAPSTVDAFELADPAEVAAYLEPMLAGDPAVPIEGDAGWLFLPAELRHLAAGEYWGDAAQEASRAPRADERDPLPAILDFHRQLEAKGIRLLLVPVPTKAAVYADRLPGDPPAGRLDAADRRFIEVLRDEGVEVVDLAPVFAAAQSDALYCRQDTHYAPQGIALASAAILAALDTPDWLAAEGTTYELRDETLTIEGDLWLMLPEPRPAQEELTFTQVVDVGPIDPESPVLVLGDSHALVFHVGGDLHAEGGGLADRLAAELGFPVDLIGVRGSGATPARVSLLRRGDALDDKKVVIWVFAAREFTQSQGWAKVPISRD